jgi:hypothetical protein
MEHLEDGGSETEVPAPHKSARDRAVQGEVFSSYADLESWRCQLERELDMVISIDDSETIEVGLLVY